VAGLAQLLWLAILVEASADRRRLAVRLPRCIAHPFCELLCELT
jgi:hypothetical protein